MKNPAKNVSNLDSTGMRIVKRGCVIQYVTGATARVARVRLGYAYMQATPGRPSYSRCNNLLVVSEPENKNRAKMHAHLLRDAAPDA